MNLNESELTDDNNTVDIDNTNSINNVDTIKIYSHNDKKLFVKRISDIKNKKCYLKIFKTIHGDNFKYTKNDNGIFFNLTNLPDNVLSKIETILIYYENKKNQNDQTMIKYNNSINTEDSDIISTSENKLNNSISHSR